MTDLLPDGLGQLAARRRADQLRAIALEMIVTADELAAAEFKRKPEREMAEALRDALDEVAQLGEACGKLEAENQRLRRDMAVALAVRPQTGRVTSPEPQEGETPTQPVNAAHGRPAAPTGTTAEIHQVVTGPDGKVQGMLRATYTPITDDET